MPARRACWLNAVVSVPGSRTHRPLPPAGTCQDHSGAHSRRASSAAARPAIICIRRRVRASLTRVKHPVATTWLIIEDPRSSVAFARVNEWIMDSEARIQPVRRPPQKSFDVEPIVIQRSDRM